MSSGGVTRAEVCVVACAEAWRGDGATLASPMGLIPSLGARLARCTFAPDLLLSDGEAWLLGGRAGRGDGATWASPMGLIPSLGARLARCTFAPDLLLSDGEACLLGDDGAVE